MARVLRWRGRTDAVSAGGGVYKVAQDGTVSPEPPPQVAALWVRRGMAEWVEVPDEPSPTESKESSPPRRRRRRRSNTGG